MNHGVVDIGNSLIKLALFENGVLSKLHKISYNEINPKNIIKNEFWEIKTIVSSVIDEKEKNRILPKSVFFYEFNNLEKPIVSKYKTPQTLGDDRLANAVAMNYYNKNKASICIDLGTCLKFDLVNERGEYIGGSISPGIKLRYLSLNTFTGNLPLYSEISKINLIGCDTKTSIESGVLNGIKSEIEQMINYYNRIYPQLTIFITGGDVDKLDLEIKNPIFADSNLTLKGLQLILAHNES